VFNQITATNLNAGERAEYTLQFTPQTDIPQGGQIEITFPLRNYKSLPSQPSCRLTGGLSTFEICSLSSNTFIIVTNSRYTVGNGVITFFLRDVTNPDEGQTEGFLIQTSFAQVYLDLTDTSTTNGRTFTSYAKTLPISV
jgi:histone deacetylase 6